MKANQLIVSLLGATAPVALLLLTAGQAFNPARNAAGVAPEQVASMTIVPGQMRQGAQPTLQAITNYWDTLRTGNPQLIFDEDFTDGAFDNLGAFSNNPQRPRNWFPFGANAKFLVAESRTTFPVSFARQPSKGGANWEGAQYLNYVDADGDGRINERKNWYVDKKDEVCVVTYTSFSDLASRPEVYGTEVAMLEDVDDPAYQGDPHYGHDLSWEVVQVHSSDRTQPMVQLEGNVENTGNRANLGVTRAHYTTWPDDNILGQEYSQTVIWRNRPGTGTSNIEQWGQLRHGDYLVTKEMKSDLEPNNRYSRFNNIQIALFRAGIRTTPPITVRSNMTARDSAQVGILRCKVGITRKADFDLNYSVGSSDLTILSQNLSRTDSANIRTGDANNDSKVDANDANALMGLWMENLPTLDTVRASARYVPSTGHIIVSFKNVHYFSIQSSTRRLRVAGISPAGLSPDGSMIFDSAFVGYKDAGFNVQELDLGPAANLNLSAGELTLRINYKGSGESEGFVVPFGTQIITQGHFPGPLAEPSFLHLNGMAFKMPHVSGAATVQIYSLTGQLLHQQQVQGQAHIHLSDPRLPAGPKVLTVLGPGRRRIYSTQFLQANP